MFGVVALLTFLLLARAFRSVVLAAKAIVLNLLSLAATFGVMTWFWQQGHGSDGALRHPRDGRDPLLAAADDLRVPVRALDGLRGVHPQPHARGVRAHGLDTRPRSIEGLGRTGRLVTGAALILFLAFASLASAPGTDLKVFATGARRRDPARRDPDPRAARCRRWSRGSASGTGGSRGRSRGCCACRSRPRCRLRTRRNCPRPEAPQRIVSRLGALGMLALP